MCEAAAWMLEDGQKQKLMDNVVDITPEGDRLLLTDLFGEQRLVKAEIEKIDLIAHEIFLK